MLTVDTDDSLLIDLRNGGDEGVTVDLTAASVGDADAVAGTVHPSVVVVEVGADAFAPFALVARLHRSHPRTPVIVVVPVGDPTLASFAVLCGAQAVVVGARRTEELPAAMQAVLDGHRWFSPLLLDVLLRAVREVLAGPAAATASRLSRREVEVVRLAAAGMRYAEIAQALHIAPRTARAHVRNVAQKLNAPTGDDLLDFVGAIGRTIGIDISAREG